MPNHARKFSQKSGESAPQQPPRPKLVVLEGGRTQAEEAERELARLRRSDEGHPLSLEEGQTENAPIAGIDEVKQAAYAEERRRMRYERREPTEEEERRKVVAGEEFRHFRTRAMERHGQAEIRKGMAHQQLEARKLSVLSRVTQREDAIQRLRAGTERIQEETARVNAGIDQRAAARAAGETARAEAHQRKEAKAVQGGRERARAESVADRSIFDLLRDKELTPEGAYRLAEWQMRRINPDAQTVAALVEAANEARENREEGGSMIMVENPFLVPTASEERVELQDGREAWMEKRKQIVERIGATNEALNKIQANKQKLVDRIEARELKLNVFREEAEWMNTLLEAKERIVQEKRLALEKNADSAHPSNLDVKGNDLKKKIELWKQLIEEARANLKEDKGDSKKKKEALAGIGRLEAEEVEAKKALRKYQGSEDQRGDVIVRKQDLADQAVALQRELAEAELGLAETRNRRAKYEALREQEAAKVNRWKEERRVDTYLELQKDGIESLLNEKATLERQLRWIDDVHIREAAFEEIAKAYGTPAAEGKTPSEDVPMDVAWEEEAPIPVDEDLDEAA